jgi:outer membrane protein assembly factor BamD
MVRRYFVCLLLAASLLSGVACKKPQSTNPLAHVESKQPEKMLYDRAMKAMDHKKYETARLTLQTLIGAYPDSEYVARAKLAIGEAWYEEGTPTALAQAESEFRDFITFFPNLPDAAEAQLKIADIHFRQMGKPDRDFEHAMKAQNEYRLMLTQYPDSPLDAKARIRLLQVQEVLAEREFRIERFYYRREAPLAAIARGKSLVDTYPLYSKADEALYILGQSYEMQEQVIRNSNLAEAAKQQLCKEYQDGAAEAYTRIVTRYPVMPRVKQARERLTAMQRPVPEPTQAAIALNTKEQESRRRITTYERFVAAMGKRPDLAATTRVGEPSLRDPKQTYAPALAHEVTEAELAAIHGGTVQNVSAKSTGAAAETAAGSSSSASTVRPSDTPKEPPPQMNQLASADSSSSSSSASSEEPPNQNDDPQNSSSSRKEKKKRRFHIHLPF